MTSIMTNNSLNYEDSETFLKNFKKLENNNEATKILKIGYWISYYQHIGDQKYFRSGGYLTQINNNFLTINSHRNKQVHWNIPLKNKTKKISVTIYYRDIEDEKKKTEQLSDLLCCNFRELQDAMEILGGSNLIEYARRVQKCGGIVHILNLAENQNSESNCLL